MSKFYNFSNFNNNLRLNFSFNYNRYQTKETLTTHNTIVRSNNFNNKEIFLSIDFNSSYSKNDSFVKDYINEINTDFLVNLNDKKLNSKQIEFFNNLREKNDFLFKNLGLEKEKTNKLYNFFGLDYKNFEPNFEENKKISIDRNKIDYLKKCNNNNYFFNSNSLDENDNSEFYFNEDQVKSVIENKENFLSNMVPYNQKSIYNDSKLYFCFVGFFIEKYVKEEDFYTILDKRFYIDNEIIENNSNDITKKTLTFKDIAIQYGKTYKYKVSPVYNITFPKYNDFHVVEDFLFCDVPYFTKDIICKENQRPLPPSNIRFRYNKSRKDLNIAWKLTPDSVGDIKGFQIFKRSSLEEPFVLIKQIEFHEKDDFYTRNSNVKLEYVEKRSDVESFELNTEIKKEKVEIYSICSIDAHGFVSNYSSQIGVKFNYNTMKVELDLVSRSGAPINMPNLLVDRKSKFFDNNDKITTITPSCTDIKKISIYATPDFATINTNPTEQNINTYKEKYKFNIFKLENSENFIDTIEIKNFNVN